MKHSKGLVFDIYRGTTHDGPGMRTTVFLKGCPLNCAWCHNPESISGKNRIWWEKAQCIGCAECEKACVKRICNLTETGVNINSKQCAFCCNCVKVCPSGALSAVAKEYTAEEIFKEVKKYEAYYKSYGGGVTVSGGEPLLQYEFVRELFSLCKQNGIYTALDTCGAVPFESLEAVLPFTDCILYDLKLMDNSLHKEYTGQGNEQILDNLMKIAKAKRKGKFSFELWIRTPAVTGITATDENIAAVLEFIKEHLYDVLSRFEICTFNKACVNKYQKLGIDWQLRDYPLITKEYVKHIEEMVLKSGIEKEKFVISGIITE